jgi:hypothetical protein
MPDGSSSAAPVTNPGPSNRNKTFARLYGGLSGSALVEFMAPVQLKPYELQYFLCSAAQTPSLRTRLGFTPQENDQMRPAAEDGRR